MGEKDFVVDGFLFQSKEELKAALSEQETITYIKSKTDLNNPKTVLKLYVKLLENNTFKTVIGCVFLKELQDLIVESGLLSKEAILSIPVQHTNGKSSEYSQTVNQYKVKADKLSVSLRNVRIINFFLMLTILIMFVIALFADKANYAKFQTELTNTYASWEEELKLREQQIEEKEAELNSSENQ